LIFVLFNVEEYRPDSVDDFINGYGKLMVETQQGMRA
jgi:hypothetical protein